MRGMTAGIKACSPDISGGMSNRHRGESSVGVARGRVTATRMRGGDQELRGCNGKASTKRSLRASAATPAVARLSDSKKKASRSWPSSLPFLPLTASLNFGLAGTILPVDTLSSVSGARTIFCLRSAFETSADGSER